MYNDRLQPNLGDRYASLGKMRIHLRIPLLSIVLCACAQPRFAPAPDTHFADAAVYRAVLDSMSNQHGAKRPTQLVVIDSTLSPETQDLELDKLPGVDSTAISDFQKRNSESYSLRYLSSSGVSVPVVLVSRQTLQSFLHNGPEPYWNEFYRRYPGSNGSISLSTIGYNAEGDVALLVAEQNCGEFCGTLSNVVVKRERGHWRVVVIQVKVMA
jgi:hypothetical protein